MPEINIYKTVLLDVLVADRSELSAAFVDWDTAHNSLGKLGNYKLPKGKVFILLLLTGGKLWTTIRRWTPQKEKYYRFLIGQDFQIEIEETYK
jgi:homospermidine synthase